MGETIRKIDAYHCLRHDLHHCASVRCGQQRSYIFYDVTGERETIRGHSLTEQRTSLVFKWSKVVQSPNGPLIEW